jgi:exodeoxyribonuclease VIII
MIDLETLATSPNAAVLTIGAVKFDPFNIETDNPTCEKLYIKVDLDSCDALGLDVSEDTLEWWSQQSK